MLHRRNLLRFALLATMAGLAPAVAGEPSDEMIEIDGRTADGKPRLLSLSEIRKLPKAALTTRTPWFSGAVRFEGVLARELLNYVGASGGEASFAALDGYAIKIPLRDFRTYDAILAYRIDGKDLTVETKGPLFLVYPFDDRPAIANETYYARCIWQIARIEIK